VLLVQRILLMALEQVLALVQEQVQVQVQRH
jgi:hypothetical protein